MTTQKQNVQKRNIQNEPENIQGSGPENRQEIHPEEKPWGDGEDYNRYIEAELASFRKNAWKKQIMGHLGERKNLKILDVGTGPGFFPCILGEEGYQVTAMDYSEKMLACARKNTEKLGVHCEFFQMDINHLTFAEESFDVIINRNVTWTLPSPEETYREFKRILKKDGILLIYDANWHLHFFDKEQLKKVRENEKRYFEKYGTAEVVAIENRAFFEKAPLTSTFRPTWDEAVFKELDMEVEITEDIGSAVYEEWEKDLYSQSPLFEICAHKK